MQLARYVKINSNNDWQDANFLVCTLIHSLEQKDADAFERAPVIGRTLSQGPKFGGVLILALLECFN